MFGCAGEAGRSAAALIPLGEHRGRGVLEKIVDRSSSEVSKCLVRRRSIGESFEYVDEFIAVGCNHLLDGMPCPERIIGEQPCCTITA